ncbi:MAG: ROK family protein [Prolixibacteraceae bacterium]
MTAYLIIDAGGTFLKSAVLDLSGNVFPGSALSVPSFSDGTKEQVLGAFGEIIGKCLNYIGMREMELKGVGIAFPGPFNIYQATPLMQHKFKSIYGLDLREHFYEITGISRDIPIRFMHDANAVLLGEIWKGNAQGYANAAAVTLGTGLGFAVSENGKVLCNEIGGPFLSIFKLPYKDGILEDYTAKRGFVRLYRELSGTTGEIEVSEIGNRAGQGDEAALQTFREVGKILSETLGGILAQRKTKCLLFCGQISRSFHLLEPSLREGLKEVACLQKISTVKSIDHAALLGALRNIGADLS